VTIIHELLPVDAKFRCYSENRQGQQRVRREEDETPAMTACEDRRSITTIEEVLVTCDPCRPSAIAHTGRRAVGHGNHQADSVRDAGAA
jgi:hypothetical protein